MNKQKPLLALLTILLLAQGCGGVLTSDQPAKQTYLLTPLATHSSPSVADGGADLSVEITAIPGLDTDRILALGIDARLQPISNARWPDHLPEIVSSALQRSLESTGRFSSVHAGDRAGEGGWWLRLEVREFYGIQDGAGDTSSVRIALAGSISCGGQRHPLDLQDSSAVASQRLASVVAAHQAGLDEVTRELVGDISRMCAPGGVQ